MGIEDGDGGKTPKVPRIRWQGRLRPEEVQKRNKSAIEAGQPKDEEGSEEWQKDLAERLEKVISYAQRLPAVAQRIKDLKMSLAGYEIRDLERLLLTMPDDWSAPEAGDDTSYWIAIAELLTERYKQRAEMQTGRE